MSKLFVLAATVMAIPFTCIEAQSVTSANGVTTIQNSAGTAGIQIGTNSQSIGGLFGAGGDLFFEANQLSNPVDTGGWLFLGGSQRGDTQKSQTYIVGNSSIGNNSPRMGILIDGQDRGTGIQNNVGIGLQRGGVPGAALEVNGSIKLTAGSGASITFPDGTNLGSASGLSSITQTNGNASVNGILHVAGSTSPNLGTQGGYFGWNALAPGGIGETDFINQAGLGPGGFAFINAAAPGTSMNLLMFLESNGNLGVGTATPTSKLEVNGSITLTAGTGASINFSDGTSLSSASGLSSISGMNGVSSVSGILRVTGSTNPNISSEGGYFGWNALTGGQGETDFINQQGGGTGGFAFFNAPASGISKSLLMFLNGTNGYLGIGTASPGSKLEVNGSITLTANTGSHVTYADNTVQSTAWTGTLSGGDYAESVDVTGGRDSLEPGDLLVIDPAHHGNFLKSAIPYSTLVGGVYAAKPGVIGRRQARDKPSDSEVPMAMVGIVPTKVSAENGPVHDGDLLVSSSTPGYAMRGTERSQLTGAVLGKALGSLETGTGVIEVLISLQ